MMAEMVQMRAEHDAPRRRPQHVTAALERPRRIQITVLQRGERGNGVTNVLIERRDERFSLLETVAAGAREIQVGLRCRVRDPARHPRYELRKMSERKRLRMRLPLGLVARHALEQPARGAHLHLELWDR